MSNHFSFGNFGSNSAAFGPAFGVVAFVKWVVWCDVQSRRDAARARKERNALIAKRNVLVMEVVAATRNHKARVDTRNALINLNETLRTR